MVRKLSGYQILLPSFSFILGLMPFLPVLRREFTVDDFSNAEVYTLMDGRFGLVVTLACIYVIYKALYRSEAAVASLVLMFDSIVFVAGSVIYVHVRMLEDMQAAEFFGLDTSDTGKVVTMLPGYYIGLFAAAAALLVAVCCLLTCKRKEVRLDESQHQRL